MQNQNTENSTPVAKAPFQIKEDNYTLHRRFDRMGRLVGDEMMKKLFGTHVMVIGLGGVGSWAAEAIARAGVGRITIIDFDEICITNANRQLHALQGLVGQKKSNVMADRLKKINPQASIESVPLFYNKDTAEQILSLQPDYVLDAIDNLTAKTHLLNECRTRGIKVITSGGASGKMDPTRIKIIDLAKTNIDPLSHSVRKILRQEYNFPKQKFFNIPCVFSDEVPLQPIELIYDNGQGFKCVCPHGEIDPHGCMHRSIIYGTAGFVTGAFGLAMASWVVRQITENKSQAQAAEKFN